jgi:hypothetical protein
MITSFSPRSGDRTLQYSGDDMPTNLKAESQSFWEFNDFVAWHTDEIPCSYMMTKLRGTEAKSLNNYNHREK